MDSYMIIRTEFLENTFLQLKTNIKLLQVEFELGMFVFTSYILPSELTLHLGPFQDFKTSAFELNLSLALLSFRSRIKIDPVQLILT